MNAGGTIVIPQEPYASHDDALLPVRSLTMWAYTDLSDPRWSLGPKYIRLRTDSARAGSQKIGAANKRGWAGYARNGDPVRQALRLARGQGLSRTTASTPRPTRLAAFIELETLGPMATLPPGGSVTHDEKWSLFRGVNVAGDDAALERALTPHLATFGLK